MSDAAIQPVAASSSSSGSSAALSPDAFPCDPISQADGVQRLALCKASPSSWSRSLYVQLTINTAITGATVEIDGWQQLGNDD